MIHNKFAYLSEEGITFFEPKPDYTMILTKKDNRDITHNNIIQHNDLRTLIFKYHTHNNQHTTLGFHRSNFENDSFIVDWQLSEEKSGVD